MNQKNKIVNISELTEKIITKANKTRSPDCLLVAISGIDGSGKTSISKQICTQLNRENLNTVLVNIDLWHYPSEIRFSSENSGEHFYRNAFSFNELFDLLINPLKQNRNESTLTVSQLILIKL